jgi:hypothetical protein
MLSAYSVFLNPYRKRLQVGDLQTIYVVVTVAHLSVR